MAEKITGTNGTNGFHNSNGVNGVNKSNGINTPNGHNYSNGNGAKSSNGIDVLEPSQEEDPICIVGMACRLPGGIRSPSDLWEFLSCNKSAQGKVPKERFNINAFYHPDGSRAGVMDADGGYFLQEDVRQFENSFFGINNLEATYMDPQQRKLLEVVFECFESAGVSMDQISGTNTGVYVGNFTVDYLTMQARDPDYMHRYNATGSGTAIMSNRVSHVFNLHGPSFTTDTACSSSIYCLHNAVNAIKNGECDGAIVAAANLITAPEQHLGTMKGGVLSPTSTCHTFDASADGYGRAEAVNAIYLKPLSSALRDGNKIWSVVRGTAINSNGRTSGITLPSAKLQEAVIRKAYSGADLSFDDTDYIECHGTGTAVGDPIEVDGLQSCFGPRKWPLVIGSVKANLGHSEAASGLTSLIKVALALDKGKIPPTYGVKNLNPKNPDQQRRTPLISETPVHLEKANMSIAMDLGEWPRDIRRASINSFGYGGANAHAIVESLESYLEETHELAPIKSACTAQVLVLPLSAASKPSLETRLKQTEEIVQRGDGDLVKSLAFTLSQKSPGMSNKKFVLAKVRADGLSELVPPDSSEIVDVKSASLPFSFIFTGQGAQYPEMGKQLLHSSESFLRTIRDLDGILKSLPKETSPEWTLEQTLLDSPLTSQINHVTRSQPICTAIQIGIVNLLRSWGVTPEAVIGHSSGEIAAAFSAGLLNAKEAILAAYFRGYAVGKLKSRGTMVAAGMGPDRAEQFIEEQDLRGKVCVACVNSPESVTLSGSEEGIEILLAELQKNNLFARKLQTGGKAYHSHLVKEIGTLYESLLAPHLDGNSTLRGSAVTMFSSVGYESGKYLYLAKQARKAKYWRDNLENPVQFSSALQDLIGEGKTHLVEIGPHPALKGPVQHVRASIKVDKKVLPYSPTLVRDQDADVCMKKLAGSLYLHGHTLQWQNIQELPRQNQVILHNLQPYPWDYSAGVLWAESRPSVELRNRQHVRHELLGSAHVAGSGIDWSWRNVLRVNEAPWLLDHKVESQIVFPAVGYLAMAMEAIAQIKGLKSAGSEKSARPSTSFEFRNVSISTALVIQDEQDMGTKEIELHTAISWRKISTTSKSTDWCDFSVSSWGSGQGTLHCSGSIRTGAPLPLKGTIKVQNTDGFEKWPMDRWYKKLAGEGLCFGPQFQSLTSLSTDGGRVRSDALSTTNMKRRVGKETDTEYFVHPIAVDACLQAGIMGGTGGNLSTLKAFLPVFISECRIQSLGETNNEEATIHTNMTTTGFATRRIDATLLDPSGNVVVDMKDVRLSLYTGKMGDVKPSDSIHLERHPILRVNWKPDVLSLHPGAEPQLDRYIDTFISRQQPDLVDNETQAAIGALLDLAGHSNPRMRVLELGPDCDCKPTNWLSLLHKDTSLPRIQSWNTGSLADNGDLTVRNGASGPFDTILVSKLAESEKLWKYAPEKLISLVGDGGAIVTRRTDSALHSLAAAEFAVVEVRKQILLAVRRPNHKSLLDKDILIISGNKPSSAVADFTKSLSSYLKQTAGAAQVNNVSIADLDQASVSSKMICISLLEIEREFLATMSPEDMNRLRTCTDIATNLLWFTGAGMLTTPDPNLTLSNGLSRALMLEQPSLRFTIYDVGPVGVLDNTSTFAYMDRILAVYEDVDDKEFIQVDGLLYTSRFGPDFGVNTEFRRRIGEQEPIEKEPLSTVGPAKLSIDKPGVTDSLHFQQIREVATTPPTGFIDVAIKAVSLNAKDIYTMSGHVETKTGTSSLEFCGVVTAVGPKVENVGLGDRVVVMAPNYFGTTERVPAWAAHKMLPGEEHSVLCTIPMAYSTAIYAMLDRGHLRAGESVLIHAGAGAVGTAAISLAMRIGATVYTTTSSKVKRDYLINELGVPDANIFNSRDASFVDGIRSATNGRGVDLIVNSLIGDLMHASWDCLANFGRFIEIGKRELVDAGKLESKHDPTQLR
ncbi:Reducing polyketide synthase [Lachnellula hyalina]|uniref:Reducing polyketide synthase n=1 Tax=Lachnellula hyalina TaxID=1316788 RepID=A0A8H8TXG5_9HELO|nr:Reducing polyketide synthase [Lachnellula hyalina]TVY25497.1 Reducing polyketide synthase [Lachnellula hyalina]